MDEGGFVLPLIVIGDLHAEATRWVHLEKVDLFEADLIGGSLCVVLMRRIRGPIAGRIDRLPDQEARGGVFGSEDRPNRPRPIAFAHLRNALVAWADHPRRARRRRPRG